MPKRDIAHEQTDEALADLEKRISRIYADARDDMSAKVDEYFSYYRKREEHQRELLKKGEITEEQFKQWRLNQIGRGERFEAMRDKLADRMTRANEVAAAYINDETPSVYSLNRNYTAYTIDTITDGAYSRGGVENAGVDFTLWDESTVKRLIVEQPDLMPYYPTEKAVKRGIDLRWGKQQITSQVTSGILQGESLKHIADRLQNNIPDMNRKSAVRVARTAITNAQNAGRQDAYEAAAKMGIKTKKMWLATKDGRTRHDHGAADGQVVDYNKPFIVGSEKLMFPGDFSMGASGWNIYNCRCRMVTDDDKEFEAEPTMIRVRDPITGRNVVVPEMSYQEWAQWKHDLQQQAGAGIIKSKIDSGEISTKVSHQQYLKHVPGTKQFEQYSAARRTPQSILSISEDEAQSLIKSVAGTGEIYVTKNGSYKDKEFFWANKTIGQYYSNGEYIDTTRLAIHYGKMARISFR